MFELPSFQPPSFALAVGEETGDLPQAWAHVRNGSSEPREVETDRHHAVDSTQQKVLPSTPTPQWRCPDVDGGGAVSAPRALRDRAPAHARRRSRRGASTIAAWPLKP